MMNSQYTIDILEKALDLSQAMMKLSKDNWEPVEELEEQRQAILKDFSVNHLQTENELSRVSRLLQQLLDINQHLIRSVAESKQLQYEAHRQHKASKKIFR